MFSPVVQTSVFFLFKSKWSSEHLKTYVFCEVRLVFLCVLRYCECCCMNMLHRKQHWWWDTLVDNDGGVVNDGVMRKVYAAALQQEHNSNLSTSFSYVTANPASFGGKRGIRVLQVQSRAIAMSLPAGICSNTLLCKPFSCCCLCSY